MIKNAENAIAMICMLNGPVAPGSPEENETEFAPKLSSGNTTLMPHDLPNHPYPLPISPSDSSDEGVKEEENVEVKVSPVKLWVTFCNMKQNILDLKKKKRSRKRSRDVTNGVRKQMRTSGVNNDLSGEAIRSQSWSEEEEEPEESEDKKDKVQIDQDEVKLQSEEKEEKDEVSDKKSASTSELVTVDCPGNPPDPLPQMAQEE